ncbi:MAG: tetratricopeptide repeat protein [Gemmatimonadota bacterium]|nr:MAG: tetratricopeptide repeat protein [Gemmatimonadota bacterium]
MNSLLKRLKERKLFQWALAYLAGAWLVLQAMEVTAEPFGWPLALQRGVTILLVVGFFVALVVAWYHGEKGRQRASGPELLMIAVLLGIGAAVVSLLGPEGREVTPAEDEAPTLAVEDDRPSIAALPWTNRSGREEDLYFTDGIHDEILTRLSKLSGLRVISRQSVMQFRDSPRTMGEIAEALRVRYVLEAGLLRAQDNVRITVQLIDAHMDAHVWAETYDRPLSIENLLDIQTDIATQIAAELEAVLTPEEQQRVAARPTDNLAAYELYMLGRYHFNTRLTAWRDGLERAAEFYGRAIEADSGFALAYSGLAILCGSRPYFWSFDPDASPSARRWEIEAADSISAWAAHRAVALDSASAEAHTALGTVLTYVEHDWEEAEREFLTAIQLNPGYVTAHNFYGDLLMFRRRWDEAIPVKAKALELDPLSQIHRWNLAVAHWGAGRLTEAAELFEAVAPLPNTIAPFRDEETWLEVPPSYYPHVQLYDEMGLSYDDALEALVETMVRTGTNPESARAYERRWQGLDWENLWLADLSFSTALPCHYCQALAYERLGRKREAVDALRTAYEIREVGLLYYYFQPSFKTLDDDPRYLELLHEMGLRP